MRRRAYSCGLDAALDVIGGKWNGLILWVLRADARRNRQHDTIRPFSMDS